MHDPTSWLSQHGLGHLAETFRRHGFGPDVFAALTDAHLGEAGISIGDRIRLRPLLDAYRVPERPDPASDPERRQLTVLFCDLVGSTEISERLDPEEYREVLLAYQNTVGRVIHRFGGITNRFVGDGLLVHFGYPVAHEDDPDRAVKAGLETIREVAALDVHPDVALASRIGIATGEVVVGDLIGEHASEQVVVAGNTPNLAAGLQQIAAPNSVVIADSTFRLVRSRLVVESRDGVTLKGVSDPIRVYVVKEVAEANRFELVSARGLTPFVGRDEERQLLLRSWRRTLEGEGQVAIIAGEAGMGKSRLVREFVASVGGAKVVECFCSPLYQNTALYPLIQKLESTIGVLEAGPDALAAQLRVHFGLEVSEEPASVGTLAKLLSPGVAGEGAAASREDMFGSILALLGVRAAQTPLVVVIEDLHWADPTTLDLVRLAGQWLADRAVFLVLTTRPEPAPPELDAAVIRLIKLSKTESMTFIDQVYRDRPLNPPDRALIASRCDGVPLYLEEITRAAHDGGDASRMRTAPSIIPETLRDSLRARLDRSRANPRLVQCASVFGGAFTIEALATVAEMSVDETADGLATLEEAMIVSPRGDRDAGVFEFNHALMREAAYQSLLRGRRQGLHARVARMFDADPALTERQPETAGWHYESAGELTPAIRLWELAGRQARLRSANTEAANHFQRAIDLVGRLSANQESGDTELRLRLELGTQLIACHGNAAPPVRINYERACELAASAADDRMKFHALHGLRTQCLVAGQLRRADGLGVTLLALASRLAEPSWSVQAHRAQGLCLFARGRLTRAHTHLEKAIELYDDRSDDEYQSVYLSDLLVLAKCNLGWLYAFLGDPGAALAHRDEAMRRAATLDHRHGEAFATGLAAATAQALLDREGTRRLSGRLVALSEEHAFPYWSAWGRLLGAWADGLGGDREAPLALERALDDYRGTGARMMTPYFLTLWADVEVSREDFSGALGHLDEASRIADETGARFYEPEIHRLRAVAYWRRERVDDAIAAAERAIRSAGQAGNRLLEARAAATRSEIRASGGGS